MGSHSRPVRTNALIRVNDQSQEQTDDNAASSATQNDMHSFNGDLTHVSGIIASTGSQDGSEGSAINNMEIKTGEFALNAYNNNVFSDSFI